MPGRYFTSFDGNCLPENARLACCLLPNLICSECPLFIPRYFVFAALTVLLVAFVGLIHSLLPQRTDAVSPNGRALVQFQKRGLRFTGSAGARARNEREARKNILRCRFLFVFYQAPAAMRARAPALPVLVSLMNQIEPLPNGNTGKTIS